VPDPDHPRPAWLAWLVIPFAVLPLGLAFLGNEGARFFVTFGSICAVAPCVGFWFGEMKGNTLEGRLGRGCLMTIATFALYLVWALLAVPWLRRWL
jgi:hypothetical protein